MEEQVKNLQNEMVRLWQRVIGFENKLSSYDAFFNNYAQRLDAHGKDLNYVSLRIQTLEEARQRQIKFNGELSTKLEIKPEVKIETSWIKKLIKK